MYQPAFINNAGSYYDINAQQLPQQQLVNLTPQYQLQQSGHNLAQQPVPMQQAAYAAGVPQQSNLNVTPQILQINSAQHYSNEYPQLPAQTEAEWRKVEYKKRLRSSPEVSNPAKKQTTLTKYWLNKPVTTENPYEKLTEADDGDPETDEKNAKTPKAPPIFVSGVESIAPLKNLLNTIAENTYNFKVLSNNQVKIQVTDPKKYAVVMDELLKKNTQCYTYQLKEKRSFKVVLKGLHPTTEINEIKQEIEAKNHKVIRINNILRTQYENNKTTKLPTSSFFVELMQNENNKDIYKILYLQHTSVHFEQPYKKRDIPQCTRCQTYGHTKNYCYRLPRCVKCAGDHMTDKCTWKEKRKDVVCFNCKGNHPASYKGCSVRKQLQQKLYPALREKTLIQQQNQLKPTSNALNTTYPNIQTYAQVITASPHNPTVNQCQATQQPALQPVHHNDRITRLEELVGKLSERIDSMLNIITALLAKSNNA